MIRRIAYLTTQRSTQYCVQTLRKIHQSLYFTPYCLHFGDQRVLDLSHCFSNDRIWAVVSSFTSIGIYGNNWAQANMSRIVVRAHKAFLPSENERCAHSSTVCQTIDWYSDGGVRFLLYGFSPHSYRSEADLRSLIVNYVYNTYKHNGAEVEM